MFNDQKNYIDDVTDADLFKCVELTCELPGASQLEVGNGCRECVLCDRGSVAGPITCSRPMGCFGKPSRAPVGLLPIEIKERKKNNGGG